MSLVERVNAELKSAMKARDVTALESIRALRGEIIKLAKSAADAELNDEAVTKLIK